MPAFEQHCAETIAALGEPFEQVHRWLDEFAGKPPYGMRHRRLRHHLAGIISDLKLDGWIEHRDPFPKDERHFKEMDLF